MIDRDEDEKHPRGKLWHAHHQAGRAALARRQAELRAKLGLPPETDEALDAVVERTLRKGTRRGRKR
jgi:hypothetical protein